MLFYGDELALSACFTKDKWAVKLNKIRNG